jgi:arylsulfatase A
MNLLKTFQALTNLKTVGLLSLPVIGAMMNPSLAEAQKNLQKKPNIIFILADDLGYAEIGCNGSDRYKTPNIDKLATQGLRFTHAYATPLCGPSRATLLTGRYVFRTGATNQDACSSVFTKAEKAIPYYIKPAGYVTTCIGKWGQLPDDPSDFSFDEYLRFFGSGVYWTEPGKKQNYRVNGTDMLLKENEYMPDLMHQKMVDFLTKNKDKQFFAYYSMSHVHGEIVRTPDSKPTTTDFYDDNIVYMDKLVGALRKELDRLKLSDNTILIFFSDNGTAGGHSDVATIGGRRLSGQKGSMLEGGSLEPLIVYWPGVTPKGKVSDDLISETDFLPTFAEITGATLPKDIVLDGQSFNAQIHGQKGNPRNSVFVQLANNYWVRNSGWKLDQSGNLFDMSKAPFEEIAVPVDTKDPIAMATRSSLQAELDRLNPKGGFIDQGDGSGRHANKTANQQKKKQAKKESKEGKQKKE